MNAPLPRRAEELFDAPVFLVNGARQRGKSTLVQSPSCAAE